MTPVREPGMTVCPVIIIPVYWRLWRLTNPLITIKRNLLTQKDVKNEDRSSEFIENKETKKWSSEFDENKRVIAS